MKLEEAARRARELLVEGGYSGAFLQLESIDHIGEVWRCVFKALKERSPGKSDQFLEVIVGEDRILGFIKLTSVVPPSDVGDGRMIEKA